MVILIHQDVVWNDSAHKIITFTERQNGHSGKDRICLCAKGEMANHISERAGDHLICWGNCEMSCTCIKPSIDYFFAERTTHIFTIWWPFEFCMGWYEIRHSSKLQYVVLVCQLIVYCIWHENQQHLLDIQNLQDLWNLEIHKISKINIQKSLALPLSIFVDGLASVVLLPVPYACVSACVCRWRQLMSKCVCVCITGIASKQSSIKDSVRHWSSSTNQWSTQLLFTVETCLVGLCVMFFILVFVTSKSYQQGYALMDIDGFERDWWMHSLRSPDLIRIMFHKREKPWSVSMRLFLGISFIFQSQDSLCVLWVRDILGPLSWAYSLTFFLTRVSLVSRWPPTLWHTWHGKLNKNIWPKMGCALIDFASALLWCQCVGTATETQSALMGPTGPLRWQS